MRYDAGKIRELNPLPRQLEIYGIEVNRKGFARCPFHNENDASFKVYPGGTFYCFGCGTHGDVITLVQKIENLDFEAACARLDGDMTYSQQRKVDRIKRQQKQSDARRVQAGATYWKAFDAWKENEDIIRALQPKTPEGRAPILWFLCLHRRGNLDHALRLAETEYIQEGVGASG